ncbi:MAG: DUF2284 domain-containing protein [Eubacterium sp.]|nr:DUF2284 domain-containing protein [Eubacterium sp.]MBR3276052.1 DUF2284 domain-containing protein [Eubacterium sp.]
MFEKYTEKLKELGAAEAVVISPADVVTAPWVQYRCRFGCDKYGHYRCCPPNTPTWKETREILDSYKTAILVRDPGWETGRIVGEVSKMLFFDGYYKAMAFGAGFCTRCKECLMDACPDKMGVFPSMEACGMDVYATARKQNLPCEVLPEIAAPHNAYGLILIE